MRLSRTDLALMLIATIAVFTVFGRSLRTEFVAWDDDINIYKNEHIRGLTAANLKWMFTDLQQALRYKPLNWFTWALLYTAENTLNPFSYHLANLLFHAANTLLVFLLLRHLLLLRGTQPGGVHARTWLSIAAMLGTLFWSLNPLRVEPVAWATGLPYGQSTFFMLGSLLCYLKAQTLAAEPVRRNKFYFASVIGYLLAVLTYPIVLGFPVVLVILDVLVLRRFEHAGGWWNTSARRVWIEKVPYAVVTALILAITLYGRSKAEGVWTKMTSFEEFGFAARVMQAFYIWAYYLWKPWFPTELSPVYSTLAMFKPSDAPFIASMILVIVITIAAFVYRTRHRILWALWLCHLVLLVPHLGLTEHPHYPSDRYGFVVGIVSGAAVAGLLMKLLAANIRPGFTAAIGATALILFFSSLSHQQGAIWENRFTLYQNIVANIPDSLYRANVWFRYGVAHMQIKEWPHAIAALKQSLRIIPYDPMTQNNIAICYGESKRFDLAIPHFREAIRLEPNDPQRRINLAVALKFNGQLEEAKAEIRRSEELKKARSPQ